MSEDGNILVVDDRPDSLSVLCEALEGGGYRVLAATSGEAGLKIAGNQRPDLILLDVHMPGMDGFETCRHLKADEATRAIPVLFLTGEDQSASLVEGFRAGAVDYITKPIVVEEVLARVHTHLALARTTQALAEQNRLLKEEIDRRERAEAAQQEADERLEVLADREDEHWDIEGFIGRSSTIGKILDDTRRLQQVDRTSVLITGENGTGKELIARAIHSGGSRASGPFVPVNCSAIPESLAESALFGHKKGAFTGADADRRGYFALADGGTLFLDEVGDMPPAVQTKLLRVLEEGRILPLGAAAEERVDVRVLAATNVDLEQGMEAGSFRRDLYFRLARFRVEAPPLRQRPEDIPLLVEHFLDLLTSEMGIAHAGIRPEALAALAQYAFPGNVRELKNLVEYALIQSGGQPIGPEHLHLLAHETTADPAPPRSAIRVNESISASDEDKILAYVREQGEIANTDCRQLLGVNRSRASYILEKMCGVGQLAREGERRWTRYRLADG